MSETTFTDNRPSVDVVRRAAFRPVISLIAGFLALSTAMVAALGLVSAFGASIDGAVWSRCSLVTASAFVLLLFADRAARGSRRAWVRLAIVTPIIFAAIVVVVSIPGFLPGWVRVEQGMCGALVLPAAILVNRPLMRALFRRDA